MKLWLVVWSTRDEWHDPGLRVYLSKEEAQERFVTDVLEQLLNESERVLHEVILQAPKPMHYEIARIWVQEIETKWELEIRELELPDTPVSDPSLLELVAVSRH